MGLPIGSSDFKKIIDGNFDFVDKSLLIKELLEDDAEVILITRPRRFGKTLNMSMLHYFFADKVKTQLTKNLFNSLKITKHPKYMKFQGKYPVIFLSFKDIKENSYEKMYARFCKVISDLYSDHLYLLEDSHLPDNKKAIYNSILDQKVTPANIIDSLKDLTEYLFNHHKQKPIVLIDEYDTPVQFGYDNKYYDKVTNLFRNFLSSALKDNPYLYKSVLTGILRISRESLFSGLNNLKVYSFLHPKYGEYFGFTEKEVSNLLIKAKIENKAEEIKNWYNGYKIGDHILYNPWSIVNCINEKGKIKSYWVNTSDDNLIKNLLVESSLAFKDCLETLLRGEKIEQVINENFVFSDLDKNRESAAWSFLLNTGYLKIVSDQETDQGSLCQLSIPNQEIRNLYRKIIEQWLTDNYGIECTMFIKQLLNGDILAFEKGLQDTLEQIASIHDFAKKPEVFYHALIMGLTVGVSKHPDYLPKSNRESGDGRYDYLILNKKLTIIMEFKVVNKKKDSQILKKTAQEALKQIDEKKYMTEAIQHGAKKILKIGIAFSGKRFSLAHKEIKVS